MIRGATTRVARAVASLFARRPTAAKNPEPVKVLPLPPRCSVDAMHDWEAAWDHEVGTVAYWSCQCCGQVRESFGDGENQG